MKRKKALIITRVSGFLPQFEMKNVRILQKMGFEVHYVANFDTIVYGTDNSRLDGTGIVCHPIGMVRNPIAPANMKAWLELVRLMKRERFDLVHCHMPVGSVLGRLAALVTHTGPVIYTVHGFHFYTGAPFRNWFPYYGVERFFARFTDVLITINREDYERAKGFHFRGKGKHVYYVPGIGVDPEQDSREEGVIREKVEKEKRLAGQGVESGEDIEQSLRSEAGQGKVRSVIKSQAKNSLCSKYRIDPKSFLLVSVGELSDRKNHILLVEAMAYLKGLPITCLICGSGKKEQALKKRVRELGLEQQVIFAGYVEQISQMLKGADAFVFPSKQEGLPVAVMEAMVAGLPVIATDIRGNRDLIHVGKGGELIRLESCMVEDAQHFAQSISRLQQEPKRCISYGEYNSRRIWSFRGEKVQKRMERIYERYSQATR